MRDDIYSQNTGKHVAFIEWGEPHEAKVLRSDVPGMPQIGTVSAGTVYDMDGKLVGHLRGGHVIGAGDSMPNTFKRLIGEL